MSKDVRINVRCTEQQRSAWKAQAEGDGYRTLSAWLTALADQHVPAKRIVLAPRGHDKSSGSAETVPVPSSPQHPEVQPVAPWLGDTKPEVTVAGKKRTDTFVQGDGQSVKCDGSKHRKGVYCKHPSCRKVY